MTGLPPDPDEPERPRREFKFKPTEFERTNRSLDEEDSIAPIDVRDLFKASTAARPPASAKPPAAPSAPTPAANDVHAILESNLKHANEAGENEVSLRPKPPSRRKRDYWLLLVASNLFFIVCMAVARNIGASVFGGAGMILVSIGLTWVMWFVMDDY
ncbi:MAG: hypothetical protein JWM35_1187 [Verrucomicrobia bacterium]|nr:hypothetical protein [Verrucomicrobiota bacterium]